MNKPIFRLLAFIAVILSLANIAVSSRYTAAGEHLRLLHDQLEMLEQENALLIQSWLDQASITNLKKVAQNQGFTQEINTKTIRTHQNMAYNQ